MNQEKASAGSRLTKRDIRKNCIRLCYGVFQRNWPEQAQEFQNMVFSIQKTEDLCRDIVDGLWEARKQLHQAPAPPGPELQEAARVFLHLRDSIGNLRQQLRGVKASVREDAEQTAARFLLDGSASAVQSGSFLRAKELLDQCFMALSGACLETALYGGWSMIQERRSLKNTGRPDRREAEDPLDRVWFSLAGVYDMMEDMMLNTLEASAYANHVAVLSMTPVKDTLQYVREQAAGGMNL